MIESIASPVPASQARRFRDYKVIAKQAESHVITSFVLAPTDGMPLLPYKPGQYLVFRFSIDGQTVLRNYSVSGDPDQLGQLRISVKHETAPAGTEVPDGLGSSYLHHQVQVGDVLQAAGPLGDFYLDESSARPVVLLSGGVGLTPMLSMLHRLVNQSERKVHFMHACENGDVHAFGAEVMELVARRPNVHALFWYRAALAHDASRTWSFTEGLLTKEQLQRYLPLDDYDFYLCGPSGFMQANYALLRQLGVVAERIHYEFFGPATVLEQTVVDTDAVAQTASVLTAAAEPQPGLAAATAPATVSTDSNTLTFLPDGRQAQWQDDYESLLVAAEEAGLQPNFNCRSGICNSCMCTLVEGEVEYFEEPLDEVPVGKVLICCAKPKGAVVIEMES
ncbi:oxidoreductase [Paenalcaligenes hominis]|uniref:nitric oxide dioxygenase n=1 Tax=Paenalcaligenes hominis TaxID=643674 RepID=A0A1U9K0X4_9BURK|nr:FAD-binding oxidoreductase [Paenalcaligenes hominis]AQS51668.1 oxidoreductase [Paenalcaligenes hominis]